MSTNILSAYFSHSWRPAHLPLNLAVWERLSKHCHLLIDQPVQKPREKSPPWYISRIESLIRRSDVFIACVPAADVAPNEERDGDWKLRCSPYLLFEIRLAERANLPRFILFDRESRFRPSGQPGPHARYVPCRVSELAARFQHGNEDYSMMDQLEEWLTWLDRNVTPIREDHALQWVCLLSGHGKPNASLDMIKEAIQSAGFDDPVDLSGGFSHDAEVGQLFRALSLLVVDVSAAETLPLYHFAHALMVPSIRLHPQRNDDTDSHLPAILRGHPAGYQLDTVALDAVESHPDELTLRARSLIQNATPISDLEEGRYELQQRGYKKHLVFISHDSKPGHRELVAEICSACRSFGIDFWEYEERNRSGEHWKNNLEQALVSMTHFIALLSETYEHSPMCVKEVACSNSRRDEVIILPFLLANRQRPNVDIRNIDSAHHERLSDDKSSSRNAQAVVENILKHIRR